MESQRMFLPQENTVSKFYDTDQILKASIDMQKEEAFRCVRDQKQDKQNAAARMPPKEMYKMGYISSSNASCLEEHSKKFKSLKMTLRQQKAMNSEMKDGGNGAWGKRKPSGNQLLFNANQPRSQTSLLPDDIGHYMKNQESQASDSMDLTPRLQEYEKQQLSSSQEGRTISQPSRRQVHLTSTLRRYNEQQVNSGTGRGDAATAIDKADVAKYYHDTHDNRSDEYPMMHQHEQVRHPIRLPLDSKGQFEAHDDRPATTIVSPVNNTKADKTDTDGYVTPQQDLDFIKQKLIKYNYDLMEGHSQQANQVKAVNIGTQVSMSRSGSRGLIVTPSKQYYSGNTDKKVSPAGRKGTGQSQQLYGKGSHVDYGRKQLNKFVQGHKLALFAGGRRLRSPPRLSKQNHQTQKPDVPKFDFLLKSNSILGFGTNYVGINQQVMQPKVSGQMDQTRLVRTAGGQQGAAGHGGTRSQQNRSRLAAQRLLKANFGSAEQIGVERKRTPEVGADWRSIALTGQMVRPMKSYQMFLGGRGARNSGVPTSSVECGTEDWSETVDDGRVRLRGHSESENQKNKDASCITFARRKENDNGIKGFSQSTYQRSSMNVQDQENMKEFQQHQLNYEYKDKPQSGKFDKYGAFEQSEHNHTAKFNETDHKSSSRFMQSQQMMRNSNQMKCSSTISNKTSMKSQFRSSMINFRSRQGNLSREQAWLEKTLGGTFVQVSQSDENFAFLNSNNFQKQQDNNDLTPKKVERQFDMSLDAQSSKVNLLVVGTNMKKSPFIQQERSQKQNELNTSVSNHISVRALQLDCKAAAEANGDNKSDPVTPYILQAMPPRKLSSKSIEDRGPTDRVNDDDVANNVAPNEKGQAKVKVHQSSGIDGHRPPEGRSSVMVEQGSSEKRNVFKKNNESYLQDQLDKDSVKGVYWIDTMQQELSNSQSQSTPSISGFENMRKRAASNEQTQPVSQPYEVKVVARNPLIVDQSNPYEGQKQNPQASSSLKRLPKSLKENINDYKINILKHLSESNLAPATPTLLKVKPISMTTQMNSKMYRQDAQELMNLVSEQKSDSNFQILRPFATGNQQSKQKKVKKKQVKGKIGEKNQSKLSRRFLLKAKGYKLEKPARIKSLAQSVEANVQLSQNEGDEKGETNQTAHKIPIDMSSSVFGSSTQMQNMMGQSRNGLDTRYHLTEIGKKTSLTQVTDGGGKRSLATDMQETIKIERGRTGSNFSLQEVKDQNLLEQSKGKQAKIEVNMQANAVAGADTGFQEGPTLFRAKCITSHMQRRKQANKPELLIVEDSPKNVSVLKTEIRSMLMQSSIASGSMLKGPPQLNKNDSSQQMYDIKPRLPDSLAQRLNKMNENFITMRRKKESSVTLENGRAHAVNLYDQVILSQTQSAHAGGRSRMPPSQLGHGGATTSAYSSASCYGPQVQRGGARVTSSSQGPALPANQKIPRKLITRKRSQQPDYSTTTADLANPKAKSSLELFSGCRIGSQMSFKHSVFHGQGQQDNLPRIFM